MQKAKTKKPLVNRASAFGPKPNTASGLHQKKHFNKNLQEFDIVKDKINGLKPSERYTGAIKAQSSTIAHALNSARGTPMGQALAEKEPRPQVKKDNSKWLEDKSRHYDTSKHKRAFGGDSRMVNKIGKNLQVSAGYGPKPRKGQPNKPFMLSLTYKSQVFAEPDPMNDPKYKSLQTKGMMEVQQKKKVQATQKLENSAESRNERKQQIKTSKTFHSTIFPDDFESGFDGRVGVTGKRKGMLSGLNNIETHSFLSPKADARSKDASGGLGQKKTHRQCCESKNPNQSKLFGQVMSWDQQVDKESFIAAKSFGSPHKQMTAMRRNKSDIFSTIVPEVRSSFYSPQKYTKNASTAFKDSVEYTRGQATKWSGPISNIGSNQQSYTNMQSATQNQQNVLSKRQAKAVEVKYRSQINFGL